MATQNDGYQCVPPQRVAQLLRLGVDYEGYVQLPNDEKLFVNISKVGWPNASTFQSPDISIYSVTPNGSIAELTLSDTITVLGLGAGIIEMSTINSQHTYRLRTTTKPISFKAYSSGWRGGSAGRITTYRVSAIGQGAKIAGSIFFVVGVISEVNDYMQGRQSVEKMTADIVFSAASFIPYVGLIISGVYWAGDTFIPGGWTNVPKLQYEMYMNQVDKNTGVMMAPWVMMGTK